MAVLSPNEILVTTCQGTRCYNLELYSMNVLKFVKIGCRGKYSDLTKINNITDIMEVLESKCSWLISEGR